VWRLEDDGAAQVAGIRVGTRVSIFWPGEGVCFAGRIASHNSAQHLWLVLYDDGDSRWHDLRTTLWAANGDAAELENRVQRLYIPVHTRARARAAPAASAPTRLAAGLCGMQIDFFPAGVVRLRGALDGAEQEALVDNALIAGFLHRVTTMDALYTSAPGQPDIKLHWNYYTPPPDDQPPPLGALELSSRMLRIIRERLWDAQRAEETLSAVPPAQREPLRVPPPRDLEVGSLLGITYRFSDSMHWHTDMASQAGWCATLSIGAPAEFEYVPQPCDASAKSRSATRARTDAIRLRLANGDVLLFNGGRLQHRIVTLAPVEIGDDDDGAWRCAPLGAGVARLVIQARPFGASHAHTYPALLEAGYAPPDELRTRGRAVLDACAPCAKRAR